MNRTIQLLGIFGSVLFVFGIASWLVAGGQTHWWTEVHLIVGAALSLVFLFGGGIRIVGTKAVKRAAGFGVGVTIYSALCIGVLALVNFLVLRHDPLHYDSTEQKVYTLAPQTKQVLDRLQEPILIRAFYLNGKVDEEVAQLLNRFAQESPKVTWKAVDPEKSLDLVEKLGISEKSTLHLSVDEKDSTRSVKVARVLGEQELINAILKLTRGGEKTVYWIFGHGEADPEGAKETGYLFLKEAIEGENLKVAQLILAGKDKIPDDAAAILLIGPRRDFLESERGIVRAYLEHGGSALFLNEPRTVPEIANFVCPLGIDVGQDLVLDQVLRVFQAPGVGVQPVVAQYGKHPITDGFNQSTVYTTMSSVRKVGPAGQEKSTVAELAFTGKNSWAEKNVDAVFSDTPTATAEENDIKGPVSIAAAFEGLIGESKTPSRVVVIGDTDFVANINIRQLFNRDFFLNSLNWVVGEGDRISVRAKTLRKSLKMVTPEQYQSLVLFSGILLPELLCLCGLTVWWKRRN